MDTFRFILPHARPYLTKYLFGLLLVPVSALATLGIPWITGQCVRALQAPDPMRRLLGGTGTRQLLPDFGLIPGLLGLTVLSGLALFGVRWLIIGASRHVEYDVRNHLFSHLQSLDQSFYSGARTGDLMARVTSDVERVRLLVGPIVMYASRTAFMLALGIPLMVAISPWLTLIVMVPLSLMSITVRILGPKVHREVFRAQETLSELSSVGQEDFSGIRVIKSFTQETGESERFRDVAGRYLRQNLRAVRISSWMQPIVGGVADLALMSLLLVGGLFILEGQLDYGHFVTFAGYQIALIWPMLSIGWVVNQYHRARASVDRLRDVLDVSPRVREPERPRRPPSGSILGDVSIRHLTFSYNGHPVLTDVNLDAPRGSTVAILGRTGAGKSTLVHMIPRIFPPPPGTVFVDGVDVNDLPLGELRKAIGFVPQESFLFSRTVGENIAFGVGEADPQSVWGIARVARFDKDLDQFPNGYEEMVGERGVTLSGGQKQRASLARALIVRPRILILDDAFSAVDTHTEEEILRNLHDTAHGMTTLVVSHRVSSIAHADRIYVLDEGRVVEEGSHEELLRRGGVYAEIDRLQRLSDELESM